MGDDVKARSTQENGCRVGNTVFSIGDLVGSISLSCYDEGSYKGRESLCGENGSVHYMEKTLNCPNEAPYCFQCGEEGYGAAKCLSYYSVAPEGCSLGGTVQKLSGFNGTEAPVTNGYCGRNSADNSTLCDPNATVCTSDSDCTAQSNYSSCLMECGPQVGSMKNESEAGCHVGSEMFSIGDLVGSIGFQCNGNSSYIGQQSFCGTNGSVYYEETSFICPNEAPYCFQCGKASYGAAKCLTNYSANPSGCTLGAASSKNNSEDKSTKSNNDTTESQNGGYCGLLSSDGTYVDCDPSATPCVDDSSCSGLMLYKNCLKTCGQLGERTSTSGVAASTSAASQSRYYHFPIVFMYVFSIFGFVGGV